VHIHWTDFVSNDMQFHLVRVKYYPYSTAPVCLSLVTFVMPTTHCTVPHTGQVILLVFTSYFTSLAFICAVFLRSSVYFMFTVNCQRSARLCVCGIIVAHHLTLLSDTSLSYFHSTVRADYRPTECCSLTYQPAGNNCFNPCALC